MPRIGRARPVSNYKTVRQLTTMLASGVNGVTGMVTAEAPPGTVSYDYKVSGATALVSVTAIAGTAGPLPPVSHAQQWMPAGPQGVTPGAGNPASALTGVLRYDSLAPPPWVLPQQRRATFSYTNYPLLPSIATENVAIAADSILDANVDVIGLAIAEEALVSQGAYVTSSIVKPAANYTAQAADSVILVNAAAGALTITLPDATQSSQGFAVGQQYVIKKTDATANTVTITGTQDQRIDGEVSRQLTFQYELISVIFDGSNWHTLLIPSTNAQQNPMTQIGDSVYGGTAGTLTRLAGNTATREFYWQTGDGTVTTVPSWGVLTASDLPKQAAPASFHPADPAVTVSTSLVMMGLGTACTFTSAGSGIVAVNVSGALYVETAATSCTLTAFYGTGTAPVNGTAATGTRFGGPESIVIYPSAVHPATVPFAFTDIRTLTINTAYWFDLALATSSAADAAGVANISMSFAELQAGTDMSNSNPIGQPGSTAFVTSAQNGSQTLNGFVFYNGVSNPSGFGSQTLWVESPGIMPFTWGVSSDQSTADTTVKTYPCIQLNCLIPVTSVYALAKWREGGPPYTGALYGGPINGISYEAAWEIWTRLPGQTTGHAHELMIWTRYGGQSTSSLGTLIGTVTYDANTYDVWENVSLIAYVAHNGFAAINRFEMSFFISDAVTRGFIASDENLVQFSFGWEIAQTNGTAMNFSVSDFSLFLAASASPASLTAIYDEAGGSITDESGVAITQE